MAEAPNDIADSLSSFNEVKTKVEVDADSGDSFDYSSGSDRSYEGDDADNVTFETESHHTPGLPERRDRRHGSHGSRRQKGGSRHKHKSFHPYLLDPEEEMLLKRKSQEIKEKENATAVVRQEGESHFMNFPIAPFNSTQFLMEQHDSSSSGMSRIGSESKFSTDSGLQSVASTPSESQQEQNVSLSERKDKEFTDIYATVQAESLQSLPKDELVKNYMSLEEKVAALQKKVAEAEQLMRQNDDSSESHSKVEQSIPSEDQVQKRLDITITTEFSPSAGCKLDLKCGLAVTKPSISVGEDNMMKSSPSKSNGTASR